MLRRRAAILAIALGLVGAAAVLYRPALSLALMGDDYQWVQHAHRAMHRPFLLLADLDTFWRPASTWTLAADRALWGFEPAGYHLTNVLLHGAAAAALALAARRLGLPLLATGFTSALWLVTPFTSEPAIAVAIRFENLLLLAWLAIVLAWPRHEQRWTRGRIAAVVAATALAAASKETWVVTPLLVVALELGVRRCAPRAALARAAPFAAAAAVYAVAYFLAFPGDKGYFTAAPAPLAKAPHMLAAFLFLEPFTPAGFVLSWRGALALTAVAAAMIAGWRRRSPAGLVGAALLIAPLLPILLVPYFPGRHAAIPYAGFALLLAATACEATARLAPALRRAAIAGVAVVGALALVAGVFAVRAELADAARVSAAHSRLLAEARAVADELPHGRPIAVVRADRDSPLAEIARTPRGLPKLLYPRPPDPYALIDAAALFEWVIAREDVLVRRHDDGETRFAPDAGAVLVHESGRFAWAAREAPALGVAAQRWRRAGHPVRFITVE